MADDYYKTLGVSRTADAAEIRKAYRKLARENHPDRNPDDPKAAETFKAVGEAYGVLSDADKRAQYDRFGSNYKQFGGGRPGGGSPFGGGGGSPFGGGGFGGGQQVDVGDLFGEGGFDLNDLLGGLGGAGRGPRGGGSPFGGAGAHGGRTRSRKGADVRTTVTVPFIVAARGGEYELNLDRGGKRESLTVKIPAGIADGGTMRLVGKGEPGGAGAGDLLLTVKTAAHPVFRRDGANLVMDLPLTPAEAALGARVDVPTLSGETVTMTIPPGTGSGAKLRLRGKGVPNPKTNVDGDQIVQTKIVVPKTLSDRQRALYEELKTLDADVRQPVGG
ncbi:DnaJ C-terminal domain-containing protein [Alienimonas californiensis]|uniref:Chaperone protein DnaJ n=1 Tax=Alienimonas californiensis TaxID=2527989 RepID=A0A517P7T6_9PLAN|nr:DnaJ C-terminal domain-containing protein [Alienimonas californiensis]QDT15438.1 Chaperone protein DnaJ [Alienimonas californiensis]